MKFIKVMKASESKDNAKKKIEDLKILCDRLLKSIDLINEEEINTIIYGIDYAYSGLVSELAGSDIKLQR